MTILLTMMPTIQHYKSHRNLTCLLVDKNADDKISKYFPLDILFSAYITLSFNLSNIAMKPLFDQIKKIAVATKGQSIDGLLNEGFRIASPDGYIPSFFGILNLLDKLPLLHSSERKTHIIQLIHFYAYIIGHGNINRETLFSMTVETYGRRLRSAWDSIQEGIRSDDNEHFNATVRLFRAMAKLSNSDMVFELENEILRRESSPKKSPFTVSSEGGMTSNDSMSDLQKSFSSPKEEQKMRFPFRYARFFQNIIKPSPKKISAAAKLTRNVDVFGR